VVNKKGNKMVVLGQDVGQELIKVLGLDALDNIKKIQLEFEADKCPEVVVTLFNFDSNNDIIDVFKKYLLVEKVV
jgi:uncharacterized protein YciU (UPF0263 family)